MGGAAEHLFGGFLRSLMHELCARIADIMPFVAETSAAAFSSKLTMSKVRSSSLQQKLV